MYKERSESLKLNQIEPNRTQHTASTNRTELEPVRMGSNPISTADVGLLPMLQKKKKSENVGWR